MQNHKSYLDCIPLLFWRKSILSIIISSHYSRICHLFSALFFLMIFSKVDGGPIVLQTECTVDIGNQDFHDLMNKLKNSRCIFWRLLLTFPISFRHFSVSVLQQLSIFYFYFILFPTCFLLFTELLFHLLFILVFSFINFHINIFIFIFIYLLISLFIYLFIYLFVCLFIYLFIYLLIYLYIFIYFFKGLRLQNLWSPRSRPLRV